MRRLCPIGGTGIKNILLIFSRHGFAVQEKAKANKPQTQEKIAIIHLWRGRLHGAEPNAGGPTGTEGPRPTSPPSWRCLLAGSGPAPAQNLN